MKIKTLIAELEKFNPEGEVRLFAQGGEPVELAIVMSMQCVALVRVGQVALANQRGYLTIYIPPVKE